MGRIANERHLHFNYRPEFVAHWNTLTPEFKTLCDDIGKPYGYSGMNVFYVFFIQYWAHEESGVTRTDFMRTL